ncbi:calcium-binding protein [Acinetobacter parvus]|uniref:calcium-binding protein n=1 Tax=Acinetobacter parvus TaxID=134533 RepID=UPI002D1FA2F5|nr:type I secretion C-terminal target domain-containing protein [Acinetobacter parvus]
MTLPPPAASTYLVAYSNVDRTADVTIYEERYFNLKDIMNVSFDDLDGSEVRSITIGNPVGSGGTIRIDSGSGYVDVAEGTSITINARTGASGQTGDEASFPDIRIATPSNFSGDITNITITINALDTDSDGAICGAPIAEADLTDNSVILNLHIPPRAGDVAAGDVSTAEDTAVAFLQHVRVTDTGTGDERINTVSFTVPTDWKVLDASGITGFGTDFTAPSGNVTSGTYTITFINAALTELQREAILDQFMIQPPAHSSKDLPAADFQVSINSTDTNTVNGSLVSDTATKIIGIGITVTPTAEALALTGNATITGLTTDYYATAADNPANWTAMDTDINAANANVDGGLTPDLSMNGNFSYVTNGFEDTWFALNTNGFDFKTPWRNEDGVGSVGANGNKENTFAVLTAYEVVRGAGGIITGLNPIAGEFRHSGSTAFASEVAIQFLDSVEFKGPEGFSGEVFIKVQARTKDYDENTNAEVIKDSGVAWLKDILLGPVADDVTLQVNIREVMNEDTSRALTIRTQTTDLDGSEKFNIQIKGIPEGSKIEFNGRVYDTLDGSTWNNGSDKLVDQGGGLYTLELHGLPQGTINPIFTPPKDSNTNGSNINLTVEAVSVDTITISAGPNAGTYTQTNPLTSTQTIAISVIGVPDAPLLTIVNGLTWVENDLDEHNGGINSAAADGDPNVIDLSNFITAATLGETKPLNPSVNSETLTLRITNLPEGFSLVDAATGNPITTLAGGSGDARVWVLTPAQIATTQIKTPVNFSGTENFTVEPVVTENDGRATKFGPPQVVEFHVTPSPEATLNLASNVWEDVDDGTYGHANQIGQIGLSVLLQNGDSTNEEIYAVRFSEAEVLAAGMILYSDAAGITPLVATGGYYYVTGVASVQNVYVRSDENFSGDVALTVDYIVRDTSIDGTPAPNETIYTGGGNAPTWTSFESTSHVLRFSPLTDDVDLTIPSLTSPTATISGTHATLVGDGRVTVNLNTAKVPDATASSTIDYDGSEHMNYFLIQNVPDGVTVIGAVNTGAGQWLIIDTTSFTGALADSVQFDVNFNAVGNIVDRPITITAVTQDGTAPQKTDTETWTLTTLAGPGAIFVPPVIDLTPLNPTEIEDTPFALSDVVSGDIDSSMATITSPYQVTLTIRMDPADTTTFTGMGSRIVVIEGGNPVAIWTKTFTTDAASADADLANAIASVMVIPASDANRNTNNLNGPLPFDITATIQADGATDSDQVVSNVDLTPVTDNATLTTTSTAVGEGGIIPVNVTVTHDKDETGDWIIAGDNLYLQVVDGPDTVIQGDLQYWDGASWITVTPTLVTGTGTTLDGQNYYIVPNVSPNTLQQLRYVVTHNNDAEYEYGTFTLNAFAINQEFGSTTLVSMGSTPLTVNQVNTPPIISIMATDNEHDGSGAMAVGSIQLAITETLMPADVNENLYSALIQDLPNGFLVYYGTDQNSATLATNAGDGTWLIPVTGNVLPPYISIKPPAYWSGTLSSAVFSLVSGEAGFPADVTDFPFNLIVTPVADGIFQFVPTYSFADVGEPLILNLNVGMQDPVSVTDADPLAAPDQYHELTTLKFRNIPDGAATVFLANNALINPSLITYDAVTGEHTITGLTQAQLDNFQILHAGTAGRVLIEVDAQTYEVETATGAVVSPPSAWVMKSFEINVTGGNRVDGTSAGDIMSGTADNDYINGHGGDDTINGFGGNDALLGETGNDILNGGTGTDYLYGGADNDFLQGGTGNDILFGGTGADTFAWAAGDIGTTLQPDLDTIKDFNLAEGDKVDAKALLDALGWNGNMVTLSNYVSVSGNSINIHDVGSAHSVTIVVEGQTFTDLNDMIAKTNFQT